MRTAEQATALTAKIKAIDSRVFARYEKVEKNGEEVEFLSGSFRGRQTYKLNLTTGEYVYNQAGRNVSDVIDEALSSIN